jgi:hypothetical protein
VHARPNLSASKGTRRTFRRLRPKRRTEMRRQRSRQPRPPCHRRPPGLGPTSSRTRPRSPRPSCLVVAARLDSARHRAGHGHATRDILPPRRRRRVEPGPNTSQAAATQPEASSCLVVAAGSNPGPTLPGCSHAARAVHLRRRRCQIEPGPSTRPAAATRPEAYSCLIVTDCLKSARRPVGSARWELDRERRR